MARERPECYWWHQRYVPQHTVKHSKHLRFREGVQEDFRLKHGITESHHHDSMGFIDTRL